MSQDILPSSEEEAKTFYGFSLSGFRLKYVSKWMAIKSDAFDSNKDDSSGLNRKIEPFCWRARVFFPIQERADKFEPD